MTTSIAAVITADIVNSTLLSKAEQAKLYSAISAILKPYKYEFYRGDSFQVYLKDPNEALVILLQARTVAIKRNSGTKDMTDIRASIGVGMVESGFHSIKTATGEAFIISGRAFDQIREERLKIETTEKNLKINIGLNIMAQFLDYLLSGLTPKQAAVIFELLQNRTQIETAKKLKKSQATINKHAQAAGWKEIEKILLQYKELINLIEI